MVVIVEVFDKIQKVEITKEEYFDRMKTYGNWKDTRAFKKYVFSFFEVKIERYEEEKKNPIMDPVKMFGYPIPKFIMKGWICKKKRIVIGKEVKVDEEKFIKDTGEEKIKTFKDVMVDLLNRGYEIDELYHDEKIEKDREFWDFINDLKNRGMKIKRRIVRKEYED